MIFSTSVLRENHPQRMRLIQNDHVVLTIQACIIVLIGLYVNLPLKHSTEVMALLV